MRTDILHEHVDADMPPFLDGCSGTDPGQIDEGIADDFFAPDGRIGKDLTPNHFNEHGQHKRDVEDQQEPAFTVPVQGVKYILNMGHSSAVPISSVLMRV